MKRSPALQKDIDSFAKNIFGMTLSEAIEKRVCVDCRKKIESFRDALSEKEYSISGLCQECQDAIFDALTGDEEV